jgi:hypothetical protein
LLNRSDLANLNRLESENLNKLQLIKYQEKPEEKRAEVEDISLSEFYPCSSYAELYPWYVDDDGRPID